MGLFGRKTKKKNRVSFGDDVGGGLPHAENITRGDKMERAPRNKHKAPSSRKPRNERERPGELEQQQNEESSSSEMLPFRQPKPISMDGRSNGNGNEEGNHFEDESDFMNDSDDMDEMSEDPHEEYFGYLDREGTRIEREGGSAAKKNRSDNKTSIGTTVMPAIDDVGEDDISKSARIDDRDIVPDNSDTSVPLVGTNGKTDNKEPRTQGKTNKSAAISGNSNNQLQSQNVSAILTAAGSIPLANEYQHVQQEQQQQQQQQQQLEYENLRQQQLEHEEQTEKTRDLVKIFIGEIWNRGEIESIQKVCSPRLRFNGHTGLERVGHEGFSRMVTTVRSSLEGYHCEIHSMVVEGRKCFCRLKFTGKHVGALMGYPPTYKLVAWMGASEFTICPRRKQILKVWELGDIKTLEAQLMG